MRKVFASALMLVALVLTSCAPPGESGATPSPTPSPAASEAVLVTGSELEPGTYTSEAFATPVTFTVPAGWKVFEDTEGWIGLARTANDGPPLMVVRDVDAAAKSCAEEAEPNVGRTAEQIAGWLRDHEGLAPAEPEAVTVGGLNGYVLDAQLDPAWATPCPFSDGRPIVMTLVGSQISRTFHWGEEATWWDRIWVLDLPTDEGGNIGMVASVCCGVDGGEQLAAVQEVVDTFVFDTASG